MPECTRKKILFLITKSNWGGAQRYVYDLAVNLPKDEFDVMVAAGGDGELINKLNEQNIRVINIPALKRDINIKNEFLSVWQIANIIREEKPDILHINSSKAGIFGSLLGRLLGVPRVIFTAHGWSFNEDRPRWQKYILKFLHWLTVRFAHQTIAVASGVKDQLDWPGVKNKITIIHNGRTVPHLYSKEQSRQFLIKVEPKLKPVADSFWSVTIAELHPVKQHDVTIRALAEVAKVQNNFRHLIIGSGQDRAELQSLITELNLDNNVFLLGSIPEAAQYLKAFDLFVLSSRSEALAYVIIEACIAGLPIIASRVGGIPEIVTDHETGILYPAGDLEALKNSYLELLNDEKKMLNLGHSAQERSNDFTLSKTLKLTTSIYTMCITQ